MRHRQTTGNPFSHVPSVKEDMSTNPVATDRTGQVVLLMGNEAIARGAIEGGISLAASGVLPFGKETLLQVMKESRRPRYYELNLKAFQLGRRAFEAASDSTGTSD